MSLAEPPSWTADRAQRLAQTFPVLQVSDPGQVLETDAWAATQQRPVTGLSQVAMNLAATSTQPPLDPGYDPTAPDAAPNALPWTTSGPLSGAPQSSGDEYQQGRDALAFLRGGGQAAPAQPAYGGNGIGGALSNLGGEIGSLPGAIGSLLGDEWNKSQEQARARTAQLQNLPVSGDALPTPSIGDWLSSAAGLNDPLKSTPLIQTRGSELATLTNPTNLVGLVAPELSFAPESGPILRVLTDVVANTAGGWGSEAAKQAAKQAGLPQWAQDLAGTAGGIAAGGIAGAGAGIVGRNAKSWMEAADSALADVQAAQRAASPEAFQTGNIPGSDSLFTAGPNGEVVGPTGNVAEMNLGREPGMGEDVNARRFATPYGRAQQANLAAEEQAAFRDAGDRAISGANPADSAPPLGGGSGASDAEFTRLTQQADAEKAATGSVSAATHDALMNLLGERMGATPATEQAAAREAFYRYPANLGGGQTLGPEQQANLDALAPHAQQLNTITDALAAARDGAPAEQSAIDSVIARNADTLPEPTRTVPQNLAEIQARARHIANGEQPIGGGAPEPPAEPPLTPHEHVVQASDYVRAMMGDAAPPETGGFTRGSARDVQSEDAAFRAAALRARELPLPEPAAPAEPPASPFGITPDERAWSRAHPDQVYPGPADSDGVRPSPPGGEPPAEPFPDAPGTPPRPVPASRTLLQNVAHYADPRNVLDTWNLANNAKRAVNTFMDFASPLRTSYLTMTHPGAYGRGWANTANILATKPLEQVEPLIRDVEDSILAHPTFQQIGVSNVGDLYGPESAFHMRALSENPYSGQIEARPVGAITNKIPVLNRSARLLNTWQRTTGPQVLEDMLSEDLASGRLPADFNVARPQQPKGMTKADFQKTPEWQQYQHNAEIAATYGKAADQALGNGTLFQGDAQKQAANLFLNFGNWAAARLQMLGNGATGIAKNVANLAPGVHAELSPAERESARMLTRLGAAATSATYAINLANGVQPNDQRMYHNGIPVVVITPQMAQNLNAVGQLANNAHIPGVAGALNFKPNTGVSLYLGLGTMVGQGIGIARAGYEGATGGSRFGQAPPTTLADRLKDAVGNPFDPQSYGMSNEAIYALRGYLAGVPSLLADLGTGRTMGGEQPSLRNELPAPFMAENLISDKPQSSGSALLNAVGGRAYEPSAKDQYAQQNFGANTYQQLEPNQRAGYVNPNPTDQQAATQQFKAQAQARLDGIDRYLQAGKTDTGQAFTPRDWRNSYHDIQDTLRTQEGAVYANAQTQPGKDPVLDGYFKAIQQATDPNTNQVNWDAVDAYNARLSAPDAAYIARNTGLTLNSPTLQQYRADSQTLNKSGYFSVSDSAAVQAAQGLGLRGVTNFATLTDKLNQALLQQTGGNQAAAQLYSRQILVDVDRLASRDRAQFLSQHPDLVPILSRWGYGLPRATLGQQAAQGAQPLGAR